MLQGTRMSHDGLVPYKWMLIVLVALMPLWMTGLYGRGYWTPDEPREADIAWRMSVQPDKTLPRLADELFLEKPPLSYWLSAAAMHVFGDTPAAARTPNLIYAVVTSVSLWILVYSMSGALAATLATLIAGSMCMVYQVAIWLAPDASLLAGCALSLLGLYRGYVAHSGRDKLLWYTLMHVGAMMAFMAKSAIGWVFPALTLFVMLLWERRWLELMRWQLWIGLVLQIVGIGLWLIQVLSLPEGPHAIAVLFWNNLAGRFTDIGASGALDYASGHPNWLGKYWLELPYYLFPWTILVGAALVRSWTAVRVKDADATPWRFALASSLPFLLLLSAATTARGIYAAPALLGLSVLVGIWLPHGLAQTNKVDAWALCLTRYAVVLWVLLIGGVVGLLAVTHYRDSSPYSSLVSSLGYVLVLGVLLISTIVMVRCSIHAQQRHSAMSVGWCYAIYLLTVTAAGLTVFPVFDQVQDLGSIAESVRRDAAARPLALLKPDETTIAMMDYRSGASITVLNDDDQDALRLAQQWFIAHPTEGLLLVRLPGSQPGVLAPLVKWFQSPRQPSDGVLAELERAHIGQLYKRYELPLGRRYALIEKLSP